MPLEEPPIPVSAQGEFPFRSEVYPDYTYILRPYGQGDVPSSVVNRRAITAQRAPLSEKMKTMLLAADLTPYFKPAEISRAYETVQALLNGALGVSEDDILFVDRVVEPVLIQHNPEYYALAKKDETLAYQLRMRNLADVLVAVECKGERYTWPPGSEEVRYDYIQKHMDPLDVAILTTQSRNLKQMAPDTEKNSEAPSSSA